MTAAAFRLIGSGIEDYAETTAGTKPTSGINSGSRYLDKNGVWWYNVGTVLASDWVQIKTATFGGTVATVDQGLPGAQSWPVVVDGWVYSNIVLAAPTTTLVKASPGVLHSITFNTPVAASVVTIYDHATAAGSKIGTITLPGTLLDQGPKTAIYDVIFGTALTIVTSGAASDITVAYR